MKYWNTFVFLFFSVLKYISSTGTQLWQSISWNMGYLLSKYRSKSSITIVKSYDLSVHLHWYSSIFIKRPCERALIIMH